MDVIAINEFVNAHALLTNGVQKCGRVSGQDFANGGVAQHGVKSPDACGQVLPAGVARQCAESTESPGAPRQRE